VSTNSSFSVLTVNDSVLAGPSASKSGFTAGTKYFWRARGGSVGVWGPWSTTRSFTLMGAYPSSYNVVQSINFPTRQNKGEFVPSDYRLIGIPGNSGKPINSFLPGSNETDWRVSWDNGNASNFIVRFDGSSTFNFTTGRGFWVLKNGPMQISTSASTASLNASQEAVVPLHSGWNIVTNPFDQSVNWAVVKTTNAITDPLYSYNGSFNIASSMTPCEGYYLFNTSGLASIRVPLAALAKPDISTSADYATWRITIGLRTGERETATASMALVPEGTKSNLRVPRAPGDQPMVYFERPVLDPDFPLYATDERENISGTESWSFSVQAPRNQPATLVFHGLGSLPADLAVFLWSEDALQASDLRRDSVYRFAPHTADSKFSVMVGAREKIDQQLQGLVPTSVALGNPFPNPFNPTITVPVDVPVSGEVSIVVHDILGASVRTLQSGTLATGRHWFVWDARDEGGRGVASGTYILVLKGPAGLRRTARIVYVR
jgi:hypothetical protein